MDSDRGLCKEGSREEAGEDEGMDGEERGGY